MKHRIARFFCAQFLILLFLVSGASAQNTYSIAPQRLFSQPELDQMLAPIALYPDALLSQILMASTYPVEVEQAADWSRVNPQLRGEQAVQAVAGYGWDPSVKSLTAFPEILLTMASRLDWTMSLGDAFLGQQLQVMDTIQYLRRKAIEAGTLQSNDRITVLPQNQIIVIQPAVQRIIYVPYYNPAVVYGPWWWPNYPPVYWEPWRGYYAPYGYGGNFVWGTGIPVGAGLFFGYFDWSHRHVYVRPHRRWGYDRRREWQHNPVHRHGIPYRHDHDRRRLAGPSGAGTQDDRRSLRGHTTTGARPRTDEARRTVPRSGTLSSPASQSVRGRPAASGPVVTTTRSVSPAPRTTTSTVPDRSAPSAASRTVRTERRPTALEGVEGGSAVRGFSARGHASSREAGIGTKSAATTSARGAATPARGDGRASVSPSVRGSAPGATGAGPAPGSSRRD